MSRCIRSKGLAATILASVIVLILSLILVLAGKAGFLNFADDTMKVTRLTEANTKLFTLMYSTKDGERLDAAIGKAVVEDSENEDLKNFIKDEIGKMEGETKTNNYRFYVTFDNKKYFEIQSSSILPSYQSSPLPSTILIAVPYNEKSLTAQVSLIEW